MEVNETQPNKKSNQAGGEATNMSAPNSGRLKAPLAPPAPVCSSVPSRLRIQILLGFAIVLALIAALIWWVGYKPGQRASQTSAQATPDAVSTANSPPALPSPALEPTVEPTPSAALPEVALPEPSPLPTYSPTPLIMTSNPSGLLIPVAGVRPEQLRDTFQDSRAEGRAHDAIDIPAPRGTPVVAVADGRIVKLFQSERGGTTLYQLAPDNKTIYYYAHLDAYADGITEGREVRRGEVIAYVGDTGNAGAGNYHLHFSIMIISDPKRYWDGTNINPYPLLRSTQ